MIYQDIQTFDVSLRNQFLEYWLAGQYTQAFNLLSQEQLNTKAFVASCYNLVAQAIVKLQTQYDTDVPEYLISMLHMLNIRIGLLNYRGVYKEGTVYGVGNFVKKNDNEIYLCVQFDPNDIANPYRWYKVGLVGDTGAYGIDTVYRGEWSANATYTQRDLVYYNQAMYYCNGNAPVGVAPDSSNYWDYFLNLQLASILIGTTRPADSNYNGAIWLKEV